MRIAIVAATAFELKPLQKIINKNKSLFTTNSQLTFHITGVGNLATTLQLTKILFENNPDFIIQIGLAGCFDKTSILGSIVLIKKEYLGDLGVEENKTWKDIFDLGLQSKNSIPFKNKALKNSLLDDKKFSKFNVVNSVSVNEITTNKKRIQQLIEHYNPYVESMEGGALHYVGNYFKTPYVQIRSISNYIGERNKAKWNIKESIENLTTFTYNFLQENF